MSTSKNKIFTRNNKIVTYQNKVSTGCGGGHLTPNCCSVGGYCFDKANSQISGNITITSNWYGSTGDCTGTVEHTVVFNVDYVVAQSTGGTCGVWAGDADPFAATPFVSLTINSITVDGVPLTDMTGTGTYSAHLAITVDYNFFTANKWTIGLDFDLLLPWRGGGRDRLEVGGWVPVPASANFTGTALGGTRTNSTCQTLLGYGGSISCDVSATASLLNNYCCITSGTCHTLSSPQANPDGSCNPLP